MDEAGAHRRRGHGSRDGAAFRSDAGATAGWARAALLHVESQPGFPAQHSGDPLGDLGRRRALHVRAGRAVRARWAGGDRLRGGAARRRVPPHRARQRRRGRFHGAPAARRATARRQWLPRGEPRWIEIRARGRRDARSRRPLARQYAERRRRAHLLRQRSRPVARRERGWRVVERERTHRAGAGRRSGCGEIARRLVAAARDQPAAPRHAERATPWRAGRRRASVTRAATVFVAVGSGQ